MDVDEFLPLSGLQHLLFCARQCALIHVENVWQDNARTVEGQLLHAQADLPGGESRPRVRVARAVWLRSERLRLVGRADVVEFHRGVARGETPFVVEYKRGRRGEWRHDEVQLCAQAMALEEALGVPVPRGAIYYGRSRRRREVEFDAMLREETEAAARRLHALVAGRQTPPPEPGPKCEHCSLRERCMPDVVTGGSARAGRYLAALWRGEGQEEGGAR